MQRLGELYQHRDDGIFIEHRATDIALQALQQLRQLIEVPAEAPAAVGGAAPGDVYLLPSLAAATVLESHGIRAVNLGADSPLDAIRAAASHHHAKLAWLSISVVPSAGASWLREQVITLAEDLRKHGASLIIGGRAASTVQVKGIAGVFRGSSMAELAAFALGFVAQRDGI
jgi:methanogenic corrinoid protein MtbC1